MQCLKATKSYCYEIYHLVQETIQTIYPNYYPEEVVDFFNRLHHIDQIKEDIEKQKVEMLFHKNVLIGTGTLNENHITRVFVLPSYQHMGYGKEIMQQLEKKIAKKYCKAYLDASLPATKFYEKIGYQTIKHEIYPCENHKILVYAIMEKVLVKEQLVFP